MRIADPVELDREHALESVMTAVMPKHALDNLSSAMREVDQFETPGPARIAVLKLDAGPTVAVIYHELKDLIEILAPIDQAVEQAVAEVVAVLRIPQTSIEWVHEMISLSRVYPSPLLLPPPDAKPSPVWRIEATASLAQRYMTSAENISLTLLLIRLMHSAGRFAPIEDTGLRVIQMTDGILFEDGAEAAPLAVYFTLSDKDSIVTIVDVEALPMTKVHIAGGTVTSAIEAAQAAAPLAA